MNDRTKAALGVAVIAALGLLTAVTGLVGLLIAIGVGAIATLVAVGVRARPQAPHAPAAPTVTMESHINAMSVPTAENDYHFAFSARVFWQTPSGWGNVDAAGQAVKAVLVQASLVTTRYRPEDVANAQHELSARLTTPWVDQQGRMQIWATDVSLAVSEEDKQLLARRIELRKRVRLWEEEREIERALRSYLRDDALATPGDAMVWWLAQNKGQVEEAVRLRGVFALLSAAATGREIPAAFTRHAEVAETVTTEVVAADCGGAGPVAAPLAASLGGSVRDLVHRVHPEDHELPQRALLAARLVDVLKAHAEPEVANSLRVDEDEVLFVPSDGEWPPPPVDQPTR